MPAAALLVVAPGPDSLLVLRNSARGGHRAGLATAAGTVTGLLVWAGVAALGLAALLRASEIGYTVLRWAGAAYLLFVGSRLLLGGGKGQASAEAAGPAAHRGKWADYLSGVGTNLFNPKVGVFFVSFLPAFIPKGIPAAPLALLLGGVYLAEGTTWLTALALLGNRLNTVMTRPRVRRRVERLTGLVMVGFGVRLAIERR
ncbi:MAG TPA: LysE family translocator [Streptosporangiaceae bacterium]|nr:LysE family translocator [Streptosporangiaceae bacterium]